MQATIKKHISFSKSQLHLAQLRASQFGISVPEYVRFLVMNDTKNLVDKVENMQDINVIESVGKSLAQVKNKNFTTLKTEKEIDNYFKNIT